MCCLVPLPAVQDAKEDKGGDKGGKPKKPPPTPVQQAWQTFLADMDDRINKQKVPGWCFVRALLLVNWALWMHRDRHVRWHRCR